jgi:DNA-binding transcriptional ArsR family regulator
LQIGDHATMQLPVSTPAGGLDDAALDRLLRALGDATRRRLLDHLRDAPGLTLSALADGFALSRQAVSKHLAVLEAADLVVTLWRGREKLHYLNPVPLQALPTRWVTTSARAHTAALQALQQALAGGAP